MGHHASKLQGLLLPAQSGKTRKVEEAIQCYQAISQLQDGNGELNLWISANNRLLVEQTKVRVQGDLGHTPDPNEPGEASNAVIQGSIFSWTSGSKQSNISVNDLAFRIISGEVEMVVVCANGKRLEYLVQLLRKLDGFAAFQKNINLWIDEADYSINLWSSYPEVLNMPNVKHVTLVSATMDTVFRTFDSIRILPYEITHPACYRRLQDMVRVPVDCAKSSAVDYVRHVLQAHREELVRPGLRAFVPGDFTKKSHEEIAALLASYGFAVLILNGEHKELRIPDEETVDLSPYLTVHGGKPMEFNTVLARMYTENQLSRFPLAITGFLCVERGITFQCDRDAGRPRRHNGFLFDYGIVPPITDKSEAYQTMARLFGNVGEFHGYAPCTIYSNSATFKRVEQQEEIAVHLAARMMEEGKEVATMADVRGAAHYEREKDWVLCVEEFKEREEANAFLQSHGCYRNNKEKRDATDERFLLSSTTGSLARLSYDSVMREMDNWSKWSAFDIKEDTEVAGRMFVCYRDMMNPDSLVFVVRIVSKKRACEVCQ